jgi:hypothetical protein
VLPVGHVWGWVALTLAAAAAVWYAVAVLPRALVHLLCGLGLAFTSAAACLAGRDAGENWRAYHMLTAGWFLTGFEALALGWVWVFRRGERPATASAAGGGLAAHLHPWVRALGLAVVLLAVRAGLGGDPARPYAPAGATLAVSALVGALAFWSRRPFDVYGSGLLVNVAGGLVWQAWGPGTLDSFLFAQVFCLAVASALWSALELRVGRDLRGGRLPFTHVGATVGLMLLGALVAAAVASTLGGASPWAATGPAWAAVAATTVALALCLWDPTAAFPPGGLYAAGLMTMGLALHGAGWALRDFAWTVPLALAPYVLLTAWTDRAVGARPAWWVALRVPERPAGWPRSWFVPAQAAVALVAVALSVWTALDFAGSRAALAGPLAAAVLLAAGVVLAGGQPAGWRLATLALGVAVTAELGWALLDPAGRSAGWLWLHRHVILMGALALLTVAYGVGLPRWRTRWPDWAEAGRRLGPVLGVLATLLVGVILIQETVVYEGHQVVAALLTGSGMPAHAPAAAPMAWPAVAGVAGALLALIAAGLCFAVRPGRDPLGLSPRGRTLYVYAADVLLVLMFVHFRLTWSGLFRLGLFVQYWPFIVMALAFAGAGLSEFFNRKNLPVLAEPLERTGAFLPLLPVLAFWVVPAGDYALLWFLAGLLYGLLSVTRHSFRFALLAALSANAGLWVLLHHQQIYFARHPQLWLIPAALVVLVAEHVNRDRLTPAQGAALRYLALAVIYVSSTADMFIAGLGRSVVLPLVLAVLSVLGVLAGMVLRVRAFLFLGVTFLLVVVLTMIWHAGVDRRQTWILWSAGILLGVAILTLFGIFEKRRNEVLRLVDELRSWH